MKAPIHLISIALLTLPALAEEHAMDPGEIVFLQSCATCHGPEARGDGPMSEMLTVPVADLTQIAARNNGVFDRVTTIYIVDGRAGLAAHGGPMPMFGGLLTGDAVVIDGPEGTPVTTTQPILDVVDYLEGLQE